MKSFSVKMYSGGIENGEKEKTYQVWYQAWEESERGWGCRPDGCSLHLTEEDVGKYVNDYCKSRDPHNVPDEYDRPYGKPIQIEVDKETYKAVEKGKNGIRSWKKLKTTTITSLE